MCDNFKVNIIFYKKYAFLINISLICKKKINFYLEKLKKNEIYTLRL